MTDPQYSPLRRRILAGCAGALASQLATPAWARSEPAMADEFWIRPRTISLQHTSGEKIVATYWSDGELIRSGYEELCWFMRDRVDQKAIYMNPILLDITYAVGGWLSHYGIRQFPIMTSAHRTNRRNNQVEGAAKDGHHTKGNALDKTIPGVPTEKLAAFGRWLGGGGVGWYPAKNFTHLDCGRLRSWKG